MSITLPIAEISPEMASVIEQKLPFFDLFPDVIQKAIIQSGILDKAEAKFEWLYNTQIIRGLLSAHAAYHGELRKLGGELSLIHEIWSAHKAYQLACHPQIRKELAKEGMTPLNVALGSVFHDHLENCRDFALKTQGFFDPSPVIEQIKDIVGMKSYEWLKALCLDYMTDADPSLEKQARIDAQRAKSFNKDGKVSITVAQQLWRLVDKWHHAYSDAAHCAKQADFLNATNATPEQWEAFRVTAKKCADKAKMKSFVLDFPLADIVAPLYRNAQDILQKCALGDRTPLNMPTRTLPTIVKEVLLKRARDAVNTCKMANNLIPKGAFTTIHL